MKTGIIIQARVGSTRLPFKVVLPFYGTKSIIEMIIDSLNAHESGLPVVIATTGSADDDVLCKIAHNMGLECFRGPEQDVLERFVLAAEQFGFERIVRICSDNPFLDIQGTMSLLVHGDEYDYVAYRMSGNIPSIKSHLGLWGEVVNLEALKKIKRETSSAMYYEHVTNYIYGNPEKFKIMWVNAPVHLFNRTDLRLTIDDETDFNMGRELIHDLEQAGFPVDTPGLVAFIDKHPRYLKIMREQINKYSK